MATKVHVNFDGMKSIRNVIDIDKTRAFLASEIAKTTDPYVPFREGYLKNSVQVDLDGRYIRYGNFGQSQAYARKLWYGDGYNFNGAPIRGSRWVTRAWAVNREAVLKTVQTSVDRGVFR